MVHQGLEQGGATAIIDLAYTDEGACTAKVRELGTQR